MRSFQALIVDDSPTQRALWMYALSDVGLKVVPAAEIGRQTAPHTLQMVIAEHAAQAQAVLEKTRIDLLVTDLDMPGIDGWQLARLAQARSPGLATLIVSSQVRSGQPPEAGLDPRCTFVVAKADRAAAIDLARKLIRQRLA